MVLFSWFSDALQRWKHTPPPPPPLSTNVSVGNGNKTVTTNDVSIINGEIHMIGNGISVYGKSDNLPNVKMICDSDDNPVVMDWSNLNVLVKGKDCQVTGSNGQYDLITAATLCIFNINHATYEVSPDGTIKIGYGHGITTQTSKDEPFSIKVKQFQFTFRKITE